MRRILPFLLIITLFIPVHALAGKPILSIDTGGHKANLVDLIFTKDGRYLVSASNDKSMRLWNTSTGEVVRVLCGQLRECHTLDGYDHCSLTLTPDGQTMVSGGMNGINASYNPGTDKKSKTLLDTPVMYGELLHLLTADIWLLLNGRRISEIREIGAKAQGSKKIDKLRAEIDIMVPVTQTDNGISVITSSRYTQSEPEIINVRLKVRRRLDPPN